MSCCLTRTGIAATLTHSLSIKPRRCSNGRARRRSGAPRRVVSVEVESYESLRYWLRPVTFDNCCLSLRSLPPLLWQLPLRPSARLFCIAQRCITAARDNSRPSVSPDQSTRPCLGPWLPFPPTQLTQRERVYIDGKRGSHQKERRKRVSVRLSGASFLQQRRGDFIERPLQAIDRPSGMDTVKPRMKSEWVREGGRGGVRREEHRGRAPSERLLQRKRTRTGNKRRKS